MPGFPKEIFRDASVAEAFLCSLCLLVFRDAVQSPCGHRYCESCIKEKINREDRKERRCPACLACSTEGCLVIDEIYPDFVARKELKGAVVRCISEGCNWSGVLQEYSQEHETSCPYQKIKCLKSGCGKTLKRGDLSHHLEKECPMRSIECKHCKRQLPFKESKKHSAECPEAPVTCSNCSKKVARSQLDRHLDPETGDCMKRKTRCIFYPLGCNVKVMVSEMEDHISTNVVNHNQMLVNALNSHISSKGEGYAARENDQEAMTKTRFDAKASNREVERLAEQVRAYMVADIDESRDIRMKKGSAGSLDGRALERELVRLDREVRKQRVDLERKLAAKLEKELAEQLKGTNAMLAVLDRRTETFQQVLAVLSNQLETLHDKTLKVERQNVQLRDLADKQESRLISQEQTLSMKNLALVELELKVKALESVSYDGTLLWRIGDIKRRSQEAASGKVTSFYSPVFYTSRHGYKLSIRVYLAGDGLGKQTHMSLFFVVMQGLHDPLLPWPFQRKVTFMLLDQSGAGKHVVDAFRPDPNSSSFQRPTGDMNIASGCPLFVSQELLYARDNYVRDDVMFIKVTVDTTTLEKL